MLEPAIFEASAGQAASGFRDGQPWIVTARHADSLRLFTAAVACRLLSLPYFEIVEKSELRLQPPFADFHFPRDARRASF